MLIIKSSLFWAVLGLALGLAAFTFNYYFIESTFWGYNFLAAPAMFALSFFSEETAFWPKMAIFLVGQYVGYFLVILFGKTFYQKLINKNIFKKI